MKYTKLSIPDVILIEPKVFRDQRGFFMETFKNDDFKKQISDLSFVQDNHSKSTQGILRGLHYQIKNPQGKLVRVIAGKVFDVAVDLRKASSTFGKWVGAILSAENKLILWIPPGFAHGFYVISPETEFVYKCTDYYAPEYERTIKWNNPAIGIKWPLIPGTTPFLSEKDKKGVVFEKAEVFE
jgi:dTDP-4-dehydrorhamnose 3,5-epimerase